MVFKLLIMLAVVCVYFPYVQYDTMLNRDDNLLVPPMAKVDSLTGYVKAVADNSILDIQPLRDLSFFINLKIQEWTRFSGFHLFNLIFFLVAIFLVGRLLETLNFRKTTVLSGMAIYAFHPLMVSAVGWVSARKHSLAVVFVLLAIIDFFKNKNITRKSTAWYFFSSLSHQIFCLLPFWIVFYAWKKKWKLDRRMMALMVILSWSVVILATIKTFLVNQANSQYLQPDYFANVSRYVLSVGRTFTLVTLPVSISAFYWQGSFWNIVGLPLLTGFLYLAYRNPRREELLSWIFLAVLAHLPTYITFINDTYLYLPLICVIVCLANFLENSKLSIRNQKILTTVIVVLLAVKTVNVSDMWRSTQNMWAESYKNEPSPYNAIGLSGFLQDPREGLELLKWGAKNYNFEDPKLMSFFFTSVISAPISRTEKVRIFEDSMKDDPIYKRTFAFFLLEGDDKDIEKGKRILKEIE